MNLLEAMRYLAALDQHRHFGRAAQACHITQPALSNALRALESELGAVLVKRGRQYEGLTAEGQVALAHAHRLLQGSEALRQEIASLAGAPRGVLHIGAVPTAVPVAARFAARLRARHAGIRPVVQSLSSQALDTGLDSLALDMALGYAERHDPPDRHLQVLPQYGERYFLVRRRSAGDVAAAGEGAVGLQFGPPWRWAEAGALPLVMLTPEMHNRVIVEGALRSAGLRVVPALETDSVLALIQSLQDEGAGELAAVLPGALVSAAAGSSHQGGHRGEGGQGGLLAHPLTDPVVETPIGWMTSRTAPPTRVLEAALALAAAPGWLAHVRLHTGSLAQA